MTLSAHVFGGYASYEGEHPWRDPEHVAHKFIQILKGEQANGHAWLPRPSGGTVKISTALATNAFDVWGRWAASVLTGIYPDGASLVPIPSASCVAVGTDAKGRALAEAIVIHAPKFQAVDALHWIEEWPKARNGGPRDPDVLVENVKIGRDLPKRPVVLVDDVITGGGHAVACARTLRSAGYEVDHVIAAARTVKSPPASGMFKIDSWDAEAPFHYFW
ncbi:phosphoribosyltransferase [Sphingomonas sp. Leaf231]|uniref:phosphoribosyltransferase n=1 Tax=Sphingomonas sp. Leaf231 TaxID=1736301 RepID=UPI000B20B6A6|nr:phosphoribosyltransferase [Sphingomonas sp. Leaf231]